MDVSPIGNGNYYIEISGDELCGGDVREIVRRGAGILPENAVLEIFPGTEGAIVFARVRRGSPTVFTFPEIEAVITAAEECGGDCVTFLARGREGYELLYYPWDNEEAPAALFEFCASAGEAHPDYVTHLKEQECLLLGPCALEDLRSLFLSGNRNLPA